MILYVRLFPLLIPIYFTKGALMTVSESEKSPRYNGIPKQVSRKDFNRYILPHLSKRIKGPKPKLSFYKIFNYILYVLQPAFTGINSEPVGMTSMGRMSINGRVAGQKMVPIRTFFRHPSCICLIPMNLTRPAFMEMVQTPL